MAKSMWTVNVNAVSATLLLTEPPTTTAEAPSTVVAPKSCLLADYGAQPNFDLEKVTKLTLKLQAGLAVLKLPWASHGDDSLFKAGRLYTRLVGFC